DLRVLVAHGAADLVLEVEQLVARLLERGVEAADLVGDFLLADWHAVDRGLALLDDHGAADGNARRDAEALVRADVAPRGGEGSLESVAGHRAHSTGPSPRLRGEGAAQRRMRGACFPSGAPHPALRATLSRGICRSFR